MMGHRNVWRLVLMVIVLLSVLAGPLWAQDAGSTSAAGDGRDDETGDATATQSGEDEREFTPGFIFNASNLLLDLSEYQGGVGGKLDFDSFAFRGLFSFGLESTEAASETEDVAVTLGVAAEIPFFDGRVSPYWGGFIDGTISRSSTETSGGDTSETQVLAASIGPLLGAEVFILDFLSAFAEYGLAFRLSRTTVESEIGGTTSEDTTTNYALVTELGNAGSLGIVIYLTRNETDEQVGAGDGAEQ
jgi:hypothetical protein